MNLYHHPLSIFQNSPAARRRRISVKSTAVRKHSSRSTTPRQRRKTVSTYSPTSFNQYQAPDGHFTATVIPSRRLSVSVFINLLIYLPRKAKLLFKNFRKARYAFPCRSHPTLHTLKRYIVSGWPYSIILPIEGNKTLLTLR